MCGDIRNPEDIRIVCAEDGFDPTTRCVVKCGIARRYIGLAEDIVDEIRQAGFHVLHWDVRSGEVTQTTDYVAVLAQKP
jgi:hypothetical protein